MRNKFIALISLFIGFHSLQAQIDTEFWFVAPEVTFQHADRPIYLRISSLDNAASITITQPANPAFLPITGNLASNSTLSYNLTSLISSLETNSNRIENKGIFIKSTAEISVYYEVYGTGGWGPVNTDIFVLKGRNALGKEFYTPFQTYWKNNTSVSGWSAFDIVATENNTVVSITPSKNLLGPHAAGVTFSVILQKGQTYSCRASSGDAMDHPTGSYVTSNKPIAITIKDDSILEGGNYDLAGDQIVPVSIVGKEYVVIKGSGAFNNDHVFICATQNNTDVFIDGNTLSTITLNAGQTYDYKIDNNSTYILTSQPAYVLHITGLNGEMGGALLPSVACTGSRNVRFTRNVTHDLANAVLKLNIIVKAGGESYFKLNGNPGFIPSGSFFPVAGSGGAWMYAQITVPSSIIPENSVASIINDSADFHLGVTIGVYNKTFEYGYFSNYGSLDLGADRYFCKGGSTQLDAGIQDSYLWNTLAQTRNITVSDSGTYFVSTKKGLCDFYDTVSVYFYPEINRRILSNDTTVCASQGYIIKTDTIFSSYNWQDGSHAPSYTPASTGLYSVEVSNPDGCLKSDSIFVTVNPNPVPYIITTIKEDKIFCTDSAVVLDAGSGYAHYVWMNGDTNQIYSGRHINEDKYWVTVTDFNECSATDTFQTDCSIYIEFPNLFTPNGDSLNDVFFIKGLKPGKWSIEIFNRWGSRVYYNKTYDNTWNGKNDSDGIYYFHLKHVKGIVNYKGWVQIWGKE